MCRRGRVKRMRASCCARVACGAIGALVAVGGGGGAPSVLGGDPFWGMSKSTGQSAKLEPTVAVGQNRIVQVGNTRIIVYDRDGVEQWRARLGVGEDSSFATDFWDGLDSELIGTTDARVIYDQFTSRFIVTILEWGVPQHQPPTKDRILIAVSKGGTNDPVDASGDYGSGSGSWYKFAVDAQRVPTGCQTEYGVDYPGLGCTANWIAATSRAVDYSGTECFKGHAAHILRKPPTGVWTYQSGYYSSASNYVVAWIANPYPEDELLALPMPAHVFGSQATETLYLAQLAAKNVSGQGKLRVHKITDPFGSLALTSAEFGVGAVNADNQQFQSQLCPGADFGDVSRSLGNVQNAVFRDSALYLSYEHAASAVGGGPTSRVVARWHVLDTTNWPPSLSQTGVLDGGRIFKSDNPIADRPIHFMYPMVMPCEDGSMGLFVTRVYSGSYVNLYFTGRRSGDPPSQLTAPMALLQAAPAGVRVPSKWGEYEGIALDPTDGNRVWATAQLGRCAGACVPCTEDGEYEEVYHTAIGSYKVPASTTTYQLTLQRQSGQKPSSLTIKYTPPEIVSAYSDITLSSSTPTAVLTFPLGTAVTLRAPDLESLSPPWGFRHWLVDGVQVIGQDHPRQITINMSANHTAVPVYLPSAYP
ncbi:MAG: hypothetical protein CHACPFDD_01364 [Phycisphaerae bacterium]|nr:hypothetical protein [Phycisphaerae bacterium]